MIVIGIDPGVNTGFAVWSPLNHSLLCVRSLAIHEAMERIHEDYWPHLVVIEDARLRTWFGKSGREQLQGAGAIKRDCRIWEDFLRDLNIPLHFKSPKQKGKKTDAATFQRITGWTERTNSHSRDAAMLVYGMTPATVNRILTARD